MKAVILAAGRGERLRPLTDTVPKPLVLLAGRPLLEHILDSLPPLIDEVILVIGYRGDQIKEHFGDTFGRFKISYVHQEKQEGPAKALLLCRRKLRGEQFLSMYADDLHPPEDLEKLLEHPLSVLVMAIEKPERFGIVKLDEKKRIQGIVEKPKDPDHGLGNLVVTGPAVLDDRVFEHDFKQHQNGEYYLSEAIGELGRIHGMVAVEQSSWTIIAYPEDIVRAELILKNKRPER